MPLLDRDIGPDLLKNLADRIVCIANVTSEFLKIDHHGSLWFEVNTVSQAARIHQKIHRQLIYNKFVWCSVHLTNMTLWPPGMPPVKMALRMSDALVPPIGMVWHHPRKGGIRHTRGYFGAVKVDHVKHMKRYVESHKHMIFC